MSRRYGREARTWAVRYFIRQLAGSYLTETLFRQILGKSSGSRGIRRDLERRIGSGDMSSGGAAAMVFLLGTVSVANPRSTRVAQAPGFVRRTCNGAARSGMYTAKLERSVA